MLDNLFGNLAVDNLGGLQFYGTPQTGIYWAVQLIHTSYKLL